MKRKGKESHADVLKALQFFFFFLQFQLGSWKPPKEKKKNKTKQEREREKKKLCNIQRPFQQTPLQNKMYSVLLCG